MRFWFPSLFTVGLKSPVSACCARRTSASQNVRCRKPSSLPRRKSPLKSRFNCNLKRRSSLLRCDKLLPSGYARVARSIHFRHGKQVRFFTHRTSAGEHCAGVAISARVPYGNHRAGRAARRCNWSRSRIACAKNGHRNSRAGLQRLRSGLAGTSRGSTITRILEELRPEIVA